MWNLVLRTFCRVVESKWVFIPLEKKLNKQFVTPTRPKKFLLKDSMFNEDPSLISILIASSRIESFSVPILEKTVICILVSVYLG